MKLEKFTKTEEIMKMFVFAILYGTAASYAHMYEVLRYLMFEGSTILAKFLHFMFLTFVDFAGAFSISIIFVFLWGFVVSHFKLMEKISSILILCTAKKWEVMGKNQIESDKNFIFLLSYSESFSLFIVHSFVNIVVYRLRRINLLLTKKSRLPDSNLQTKLKRDI